MDLKDILVCQEEAAGPAVSQFTTVGFSLTLLLWKRLISAFQAGDSPAWGLSYF